jgi:activator of 2-hydroxyglutaryl-CoA dehydratase
LYQVFNNFNLPPDNVRLPPLFESYASIFSTLLTKVSQYSSTNITTTSVISGSESNIKSSNQQKSTEVEKSERSENDLRDGELSPNFTSPSSTPIVSSNFYLNSKSNDFDEFRKRHEKCCAKKESLLDYLKECYENESNQKSQKNASSISFTAPLFLGIDVGSTTTKVVLLGIHSQLLFTDYGSNQGIPLQSCINALKKFIIIIHSFITILNF